MKNVLGIDIGGTNTKLGVVDQSGEVVYSHQFKTFADRSLDNFLERLKIEFIEIKNKFPTLHDTVGVGIPNYSSIKKQLVDPPNLCWHDTNIEQGLVTALQSKVLIENDANVAALGEQRWGKGKGVKDFVVITVGTGIGSGIISEGRLLLGNNGFAAEAGHLCLDSSSEARVCGCGKLGHFEAYCSVKSIKKQIKEKLQRELSYQEILELFKANDPTIFKTLHGVAKKFAQALAGISALFNPQKIILAGGGMVIGEPYKKMIEEYLPQYIFSQSQKDLSLEISDLSISDGAILGAAALIYEN